jgi:uncharacterized protein YcbX
MTIEIGHIEAIFRYPVKSMAGVRLEAANLGWHGLDGDRRLAFRKTRERSGFPWLTAGRLPDLLRFTPVWREKDLQADLPTHVRTPDGREMEVFGEELAAEVGLLHGAPVEMMEMRQGIFDEGSLSVISVETLREIGNVAGMTPDVRRFRPNVLVRLLRPDAFQEDGWVGGVLSFGEVGLGPSLSVTMRDLRCSMVNLDPDSARSAPQMMKAIVQMNQNTAGIYGTVVRTGHLAVGQTVHLQAPGS